MTAPEDKTVREFRHMLLWPLQLRRLSRTSGFAHPWETLAAKPGPWKPVKDNLLVDDESCQLGYREFVYFLPYVQRFLYGFGEADARTPSSLHIFQRDDIARARVTLRADETPLDFQVTRLRLIFFYDVDIALLAIEIVAHDVPLADAVETMDRFGRPYPPSWEGPGQAALTVVSACGMVGMVATGFLGMNIFEHASYGPWEKTAIFLAVFIPAILLTGYTVLISRRLATFMETLASERLTWREKTEAFHKIWGSGKRARMKRVAGGDAPTRRTSRAHPEHETAISGTGIPPHG